MLKTQTIAGIQVTLEEGRHYLASRPLGVQYSYNVTISDDDGPYLVLEGLKYEKANAFINEFNNGKTPFDGRVW